MEQYVNWSARGHQTVGQQPQQYAQTQSWPGSWHSQFLRPVTTLGMRMIHPRLLSGGAQTCDIDTSCEWVLHD